MTLPPATICVVRHGETDWNAAGILQGWLDVPLNETGVAQAYAMAASFTGQNFDLIYSSPLARALGTASIVADRLDLPPPDVQEGLKERCFGVVQGVPKNELAELNPILYQQILKRNPAANFEQGESMHGFATRVLDALREIGTAHPGRKLLAITHGWVMDVITRHIQGLPPAAILNMKRKNGECLWLSVDDSAIEAFEPAWHTEAVA